MSTELPRSIATAPVFPFFTEKDDKLTSAPGGRDLLGILPVWSAIGRNLVPNIASPAAKLDGLRAILLIEWLAQQPAFDVTLGPQPAFRRYFRLMEGIVEFWLRKNGGRQCFGRNALVGGADDFTVKASTRGIVANGLFQYYRGTCRRAGYVQANGTVCQSVQETLSAIWKPQIVKRMHDVLAQAIGKEAGEIQPLTILAAAPELDRALGDTFAFHTFHALFNSTLFGNAAQRTLASVYGGLPLGSLKNRVALLESPELQHEIDCVRRCEPFLVSLYDVFDLLRNAAGQRTGAVAARLVEFQAVLAARARDFLTLAGEVQSARMRDILGLAQCLVEDLSGCEDGLKRFIHALIDYHQRCMAERGKEPVIRVESDHLLVLLDGDRSPDVIADSLRDAATWRNDYFLNVAAGLYLELFPVNS